MKASMSSARKARRNNKGFCMSRLVAGMMRKIERRKWHKN
jgi:hypothetical protein